MTDAIDWMPLSEAYAYVLEIRRFPERAYQEILERLQSNELGARAGSLRVGLNFDNMAESTDRPISSYLFQVGHVDFLNNSLRKLQGTGSRNLWAAQAVDATEIQVNREEVERIWSKPITKPGHKGGAPEKHNWAAAFAYCGWWVAANGLPSEKSQLVAVVESWFREIDGGVPKDDRELRRRVSQAYDELMRLGSPAGNGFKPGSDP